MALRDKQYRIEGVTTIHFELKCDTAKMPGYDEEDIEDYIRDSIEDDPAEFFGKHQGGITVTDFQAGVDISSCYEEEPDWGAELTKILVRTEQESIAAALAKLSKEAKRKLVLELTGTTDPDGDDD
jgi:hypothetical protein